MFRRILRSRISGQLALTLVSLLLLPWSLWAAVVLPVIWAEGFLVLLGLLPLVMLDALFGFRLPVFSGVGVFLWIWHRLCRGWLVPRSWMAGVTWAGTGILVLYLVLSFAQQLSSPLGMAGWELLLLSALLAAAYVLH